MDADLKTVVAALAALIVLFVLGQQFMRRWNRRLIEEANRKLRLPVPEIQYANRRQIIDRLLDDEGLQQRIEEQVEATGVSAAALRKRCRTYAREIVPSFSAVFYFRFGYWISRVMLRSLYHVHVHLVDSAAMDRIEPGASVVLVMNHRSNMDVLLIAYLASRRSTLINTAGEWARMWPLNFIVHWAGDCITDRDASDELYKYLYKAFVQMAVRERANIGIYPEAQLTRDGKMQDCKFGLLNYCVSADPANADKLYLIPVGINYDRNPEEHQLVSHPDVVYRHHGILEKLKSIFVATVEFTARFVLPARGQFGHACANFGRPIALGEWQAARGVDGSVEENRYQWVSALGHEIIEEVSKLIPVLPSQVLATLLVNDADRVWSLLDLQTEGMRLSKEFRDGGGFTCMTDADEKQAYAEAVDDFTRRKLLSQDASGQLRANMDEMPVLHYLGNSVVHLLGKS